MVPIIRILISCGLVYQGIKEYVVQGLCRDIFFLIPYNPRRSISWAALQKASTPLTEPEYALHTCQEVDVILELAQSLFPHTTLLAQASIISGERMQKSHFEGSNVNLA